MVSDQPGILARSIRRFCKDTDLGRSLVYQEIKTGKLRSIKVGRRRLILDEDGRAWLNSFRPALKKSTASNKLTAAQASLDDPVNDRDPHALVGCRPPDTNLGGADGVEDNPHTASERTERFQR